MIEEKTLFLDIHLFNDKYTNLFWHIKYDLFQKPCKNHIFLH